MPKALTVDRNFVQALFMAGLKLAEISKQTGVSVPTIHTWCSRYGWQKARSETIKKVETVYTGLQSRSLGLRETFATDLQQTASALAKVPLKANYKAIRQRVECLEPLARTAKTVFGWGDETKAGLIVVGDIRQLEQASTKPVIETEVQVDTQAQPQALPEPKPEQ